MEDGKKRGLGQQRNALAGPDIRGTELLTEPQTPTKSKRNGKYSGENFMSGKNQHVVPRGKEWAVPGEGNNRVTSTHLTQKEAIDRAREIARNQQSELVIHSRDGRFRARDSHGNDPFPPEG